MKRSALIALLCFSCVAFGQETRSTLTGHVSDPSGARIPDATVRVMDTDTGVVTNAKSNSAGDYTVPFLQPGNYRVEASHEGFKTYTHTGLVLQTEQTVTENITLPVGGTSETITVQGENPMVDTADASTGDTLTAEQVEELPSNGRSPLGFAHLEYGVVAKGKHAESQTTPFGNSTADDFSVGGGASSSNELLLNGVPNMQDSSRTAGYSPQLDSVDAVHVDLFTANAAMGDSSGGTVNITTKSGTNQYHGTVSEYYAGSRPLQAKPYFQPVGVEASSTHFNQFGATIGGPVWFPKIYNGRNKLFFFYAFEGYRGNAPATTITTVPTAAERTGDFSALLNLGTNITVTRCKGVTSTINSYQLFNPYSGVADPQCPGQTLRSPIPGNVLSNAGLSVSPVAQAYLKLIPLPNYSGASTKSDGENNFFADDPTSNRYYSQSGRLDYNLSTTNRLSFEAHESKYTNAQSNIFADPLTGTSSIVVLWGGFAEDVHNFNPSTSLDVRLGLSRSENSSTPNSLGINPTSLGFASYLGANSTAPAIPYLTFSDNGATIPSLSANPGNQAYFDTVQLYSSFNKIIGRHSLKFGEDIRANKDSTLGPGSANGQFAFSAGSGSGIALGSSAGAPSFGGGFALFDLGLPTSGSETIATRFQYNNWYFAGFAQDDWKVMSNLTISAGIRLEHETPIVESNNRMVATWNPSAINGLTAAAEKAYAAAPNASLPASAFLPTGGIVYASPSQRNSYNTAPLYASPRIGFAYSPPWSNGTLAIRGGFAVYLNPFNDYNAGQAYGYTATSTYINSNLSTGVPTSTLADPFNPSVNPIIQPVGNALGVNTNLGGQVVYIDPNPKVAYVEKTSLDVEKQFGKSWMVEIGGFSAHGVHLSYQNQISSTALLPFLSHSQYADTTVTNFFKASVTNPFYGLYPAGTTTVGLNTSKTTTVAQLLQGYPEYTAVYEQLVPGENSQFNSLNARLEKRMSHGFEFNINYEYSRLLGAQSQLNPGGPLWYGETTSDFPQHLAATGIFALPFGRGQRFLNESRVADEIVGGWRLTAIYQALSGTPIQWSTNVSYTGNFSNFHNHPHDASGDASFNTAGFDTINTDPAASTNAPNAFNYRTFPEYLLRSDGNNNWDFSILKDFTLGERFVIQPRVDAFNALNHAQFSSANVSPTSKAFGTITSQLNSGRNLQGGIHILF
ncbi:MAG TPA: TonB-dependent receptor [Acidobacteriaceae bacterium]|nr:TonB-dependent receptor [Acidobacteriaceae bacterium]